MSFFNKILASVGVGAATVDTKLEKTTYTAGEKVSGTVEISGGNVAQQIDSIYLAVNTSYIREVDDHKYNETATIEKVRVSEPFTIEAGEKKVFPFSFTLPIDSPITIGNSHVWVHTGLDIKSAIDPTDKDFIDVKPSPIAAAVLDAVEQLGFRLRKAECEKASLRVQSRYPFVQEFEFVPTSGAYRGMLDELEVMFTNQNDQTVEILLQVDRKARGLGGFLAEALDMDESFVRLSVSTQDIPNLSSKLRDVISRYV